MAYKIKIENFEGPFDLLLYLVSRKKVDVSSIPIAEIADQYLAEVARMDNLDLDVATDFMLVAATLLELKAQALLPAPTDDAGESLAELAPSEVRDILIARLLDYKKFKNVASALGARLEAESRMHPRTLGPDESFLGLLPDFLEGVTLDSIAFIAANAFSKKDIFLLDSEHIAAKPIPVEVHVRAICARVKNARHLAFSDLIEKNSTPELLVVSFLAILELYKRQIVNLNQKTTFGDIYIDYIEGSPDLVF